MRARRFSTIVMLAACALVAALAVLGGQRAAAGPRGGSSVYPPRAATVTFSHAAHAARGASCVVCHPAAPSSRSAVDDLLPTERECRGCHAIDRGQPNPPDDAAPVRRCVACHPGFRADTPASANVASGWTAPPSLKFGHAAHRATACATRHVGVERDDGRAGAAAYLPTMASCLTCHQDGARTAACTRCHLADASGKIDLDGPLGPLRPVTDSVAGAGDAHGADFVHDHGRAARRVERRCGACHDDGYCADCHQGAVRDGRVHDADYLAVHGLDARRNPTACAACHRAATFCVGCHERTGVGTRADTAFPIDGQGARFHPDGWASPSAADPNLHAQEARRRITTCASCHRETDCTTCHSAEVGLPNASPHPPGWRGSVRCRAMDRSNRRLCLRCHVDPAQLGCDWSAE